MAEELTLEQVAAAREEWRAAVERAQAKVEETKRPYHAACGELSRAEGELERIELALHTAKRAHFVAAAAAELGVETAEPPVIVVPQSYGLPDVFELVALDAGGAGLYLHRPDRPGRGGGKVYAIRAAHVPAPVLAIVDDDELGYYAKGDALHELGVTSLMSTGRGERHGQVIRRVHNSEELVGWEEQGRGDFGMGSGARKPLKPPGGGKWRWLKVREQEELPASRG